MNTDKFNQIKKDYCIEVTKANLGILDNESNYVYGDILTYNYNNGVVSFIDENGISYVTPFYEIINTLEQMGYNQSGLYVPFTNNTFLNKNQKWVNLVAYQRRNILENSNLSEQFNIVEESSNTLK